MFSIDKIIITETTQGKIQHYRVGVSNIWERDLADEKGTIQPRMSAQVSISTIESDVFQRDKVFEGSILELGESKYKVVEVDEGTSERKGFIALQLIQ